MDILSIFQINTEVSSSRSSSSGSSSSGGKSIVAC
jgi:hypothetical protein